MNEKDKHKLIGKLSGAVVVLSIIVIGLIVVIMILFAFQDPQNGNENKFEGCGVVYPDPHGRTHDFKNGENLFNQHCASCHFPDRDMTGPAIKGARYRGEEYAYTKWIYDFIQKEDSLVQIEDPYTLKVRKQWNWLEHTWFHKFPLSNSEIDDLLDYVN